MRDDIAIFAGVIISGRLGEQRTCSSFERIRGQPTLAKIRGTVQGAKVNTYFMHANAAFCSESQAFVKRLVVRNRNGATISA